MKTFYVYVLICSDGTLYTGYTTSIEDRLKKHNLGLASKYTRTRLPVKLVYYETTASKSLAMQREYVIKRMSRTEKLALISQESE
ncbi:putative endonuclease [Desulfotomaculum arcticum]|uniref:Putative endonuclease n=1 Tax=Desulfotruncus arcticus DSM 17038 TaxID=1121424 RepID=A0A1I2TLQ5_9FIRM|nr:GIY-YIG nuclease family protein [Desulfotruncus arcticus]SFG65854.1 putative endonuclease [Desulfotomaculum arcticum] [Desulfotruncus arcticus DSM 17038]